MDFDAKARRGFVLAAGVGANATEIPENTQLEALSSNQSLSRVYALGMPQSSG
jgi:hypothetical protein